jgi:hypothetical protein
MRGTTHCTQKLTDSGVFTTIVIVITLPNAEVFKHLRTHIHPPRGVY